MTAHSDPSLALSWLVEKLTTKKDKYPKTIIYCQTVSAGTKVLTEIVNALSSEVASLGLVRQFYTSLAEEDKDMLIRNFSK